MSFSFRKSLFGFHPDDVTAYITTLQQETKKEQDALKHSLDDLRAQLEKSRAETVVANEINDSLSRKLAAYEDQINGIRTMSEAISRYYLVTQSSCEALLNGAKEEREATDAQIARQLQVLSDARQAFLSAKEQMDRISEYVAMQVDSVNDSLSSTEDTLTDLQNKATEAVNTYRQML